MLLVIICLLLPVLYELIYIIPQTIVKFNLYSIISTQKKHRPHLNFEMYRIFIQSACFQLIFQHTLDFVIHCFPCLFQRVSSHNIRCLSDFLNKRPDGSVYLLYCSFVFPPKKPNKNKKLLSATG